MTVEQKLNATLDECRTHARILLEARKELGGVRYDAERVLDIKASELRILDQMAYRFSKLQDSVGEKMLPLWKHAEQWGISRSPNQGSAEEGEPK